MDKTVDNGERCNAIEKNFKPSLLSSLVCYTVALSIAFSELLSASF